MLNFFLAAELCEDWDFPSRLCCTLFVAATQPGKYTGHMNPASYKGQIRPSTSCFYKASHAGVFSGARISSLPTKFVGRDEIRAPLKTPAWEASFYISRENLKQAS